MAGPLSTGPLLWLIRNGVSPRQVAVPAHLNVTHTGRAELPVDRPLITCAQVAQQFGIPVIGVSREWLARLSEHDCDTLLSACWPWRLPENVITAYPRGAYNLHPSLLPGFRGPAPLFWQLREDANLSGMTLHELQPALDTGPIVAQHSIAVDDDAIEESLSRTLGNMSGLLLADWLDQLMHGAVRCRPQSEADSSYQPMPGEADFVVPVQWTCRRAFRFIHGTAGRNHPFWIQLGARRIRIRTAVARYPGRRLSAPSQPSARGLTVQFADGALELILA